MGNTMFVSCRVLPVCEKRLSCMSLDEKRRSCQHMAVVAKAVKKPRQKVEIGTFPSINNGGDRLHTRSPS